MTIDTTCISCRLMFRVRLKEGETSHYGKCPKCGRKYKVEKKMKNRYLVFTYDTYYPCGGWHDLGMTFETLDEAVAYAIGETTLPDELGSPNSEWAQVVDLETMSQIPF